MVCIICKLGCSLQNVFVGPFIYNTNETEELPLPQKLCLSAMVQHSLTLQTCFAYAAFAIGLLENDSNQIVFSIYFAMSHYLMYTFPQVTLMLLTFMYTFPSSNSHVVNITRSLQA